MSLAAGRWKSYSCEGALGAVLGTAFTRSDKVLDASTYAPGPLLCRVRCEGEILHDSDKLVCRTRTLLKAVDVTEQLRWFALECAEHIQHLSSDKRVSACNAVTRRYLNGQATVEELNSAWAAAGDAARACCQGCCRGCCRGCCLGCCRGCCRCQACCQGCCQDAGAAAGAAWDAATGPAARAAAREWQRRPWKPESYCSSKNEGETR